MSISDKTLQQHVNELPQEISPERDLWVGIEKAIEHQSQQSTVAPEKSAFKTPVAWAASMVAAVLLTWLGSDIYAPSTATPQTIAVQMHHQFEQQKNMMLTSFGHPNLKELPVSMQVELQQLDKARTSIEKALTDDENNSDLIDLLHWTQQQELKLIERLYRPLWQTI